MGPDSMGPREPQTTGGYYSDARNSRPVYLDDTVLKRVR